MSSKVHDRPGSGRTKTATARAATHRLATALLALAVLGTGCVTLPAPLPIPNPTPPSPTQPWVAAPELVPPAPPAPPPLELPPWIAPGTPVSLAQVVDVALRTSPITRETWAAARAAASEVGIRQADLWPRLDASLGLSRVKTAAVGGLFTFQQTTWGPSIDLSYLLFDFGGRKADVEDARQALVAANFEHNAAIQDVVLAVERAYYDYATALEARRAAEADVAGAGANLDAAEARHDAGLATIADVLQARTARSQAQLRLDTLEGAIRATRGSLNTSMGLPANLPIHVEELPKDLPVDEVGAAVEEVLERAVTRRPDLLAARAEAIAAAYHVDQLRAEGLPTLGLSAGVDRIYYETVDDSEPANNWNLALTVRYPLFRGWKSRHEVEQARHEAAEEAAAAESLEQRARLEVWTSYYDLETAAKRVRTSQDLLASATQSAEVAAGRYKAGVGSILDLLSAQATLADARAQELAARADWLLAVAQLARDSGVLEAPPVETLVPVEPLVRPSSTDMDSQRETDPESENGADGLRGRGRDER